MPDLRRAQTRLIAIITLLICVGALPCASSAAPPTARLTLLYTNDVHGHILPFDYDLLGTQLTNVGGAARRATVIRQIKSEAGNPVLVMDAGDVFQRGPLADLHGAPDVAVMNAVPYDVMTFGNNEFKAVEGSDGLPIVKERLAEAKFAVVCANVLETSTGKRLAEPYRIFDLGGVRVAVFGLLTSRNSALQEFSAVKVDDPIAAAKALVPELRKQADYVVALTHVGVARDLQLASTVPGIDVIVGGDSHTWLFQPLLAQSATSKTIICHDGEWGSTVGRLDVTLNQTASGYSTSSYRGNLVQVDSAVKPAPDIEAILDKYAAPYRTPVCKLTKDVTTSSAADWVAARMRDASAADIAIEPRSNVEQGLRSGIVTALDVRAMFPFTDSVAKIKVTAKALQDFVSEEPDLALAGATIFEGDVCIGGKKLAANRSYTLAVPDWYATHSPALKESPLVPLRKTIPQLVTDYLSSHFSRN